MTSADGQPLDLVNGPRLVIVGQYRAVREWLAEHGEGPATRHLVIYDRAGIRRVRGLVGPIEIVYHETAHLVKLGSANLELAEVVRIINMTTPREDKDHE